MVSLLAVEKTLLIDTFLSCELANFAILIRAL